MSELPREALQSAALANLVMFGQSDGGAMQAQAITVFESASLPCVEMARLTRSQLEAGFTQSTNNYKSERGLERLLVCLVKTHNIRNRTNPVNIVAGINSTVSHTELTICSRAITVSSDTPHDGVYMMYNRKYSARHELFELEVSNVEARCVHVCMAMLCGHKYGFWSVLGARAGPLSSVVGWLRGVVTCGAAVDQSADTHSSFKNDRGRGQDPDQDQDQVEPEQKVDYYLNACELLPALNSVAKCDGVQEVACSPDMVTQSYDDMLAVRECMEHMGISITQEQAVNLEVAKDARSVRVYELDYDSDFTKVMKQRLREVDAAVVDAPLVCSQVTALCLYVIGRFESVGAAMAANGQSVYDAVMSPQYRWHRLPAPPPPSWSTCILDVSLPPLLSNPCEC